MPLDPQAEARSRPDNPPTSSWTVPTPGFPSCLCDSETLSRPDSTNLWLATLTCIAR